MPSRIVTSAVVTLALATLGVACAHETDASSNMTTTTAAAVHNDPVARIAKARCKRAQECDRVGAGQMYADVQDCGDREREAAAGVAASCTKDINRDRLEKCLGQLEQQYCDANLGPVASIEECRTYCGH